MHPSTITVQPDYFSSQLQAQRRAEELAAAQKKLEEYEDLITKLYCNSCGQCKANFAVSASPLSVKSSLASDSSTLVPSLTSDSPHPSTLSTKALWYRRLRPRISLPGSFKFGRKSPTTSLASSHSISTTQIQTFPEPSGHDGKVLVSPDPTSTQAQYFVKSDHGTVGRPSLQVKLEHVWTHKSLIYSLNFSPDGKYLAVGVANSGFDSQKTYLYDVVLGKSISRLADPYAKPKASQKVNEFHPSVHHLSFSPGDGSYLATGHSSGHTMVWQVGKKHVRNVFRASYGRQNYAIDFSPDGRFVVASTTYGLPMRIWSMRDGSSIALRDNDGKTFASIAVKFSPDGKHVVASDLQGILRLWNVRTSRLVRKWKAHQAPALSVAFTPNGRELVTASHDNTLKFWDLGSLGSGDLEGVEVLKIAGHTAFVDSIAISPDGQWVISGSYDRTARIWDMVDASLQCTLLGHENVVASVDFSPAGNYVACGSRDGKVSVWRYESSGDY